MSNVVTGVTEAAAPEDPAATQTPTVTHYQLVAANLNKAIDDMLALMPNLVEVHPATKGAVRSQKTVSNAFIISAIAAVEQNPEIEGLHRFDVTEARDVLQFSEAFRPMRDKLYAATINVGFSIDVRRANIVEPALEVYALTKAWPAIPSAPLPPRTPRTSNATSEDRGVGRKR